MARGRRHTSASDWFTLRNAALSYALLLVLTDARLRRANDLLALPAVLCARYAALVEGGEAHFPADRLQGGRIPSDGFLVEVYLLSGGLGH